MSADAIRSFAELTGDRSPIHLDAEFARASGFTGPIAHGLLTGAWVLGALAREAPARLGVGEPGALVTGYSLRLSSVVVCGDRLSFRFDDLSDTPANSSARHTRFEVVNQRDEVAASGEVVLHPDGAAYLAEQTPAEVELLPSVWEPSAGAPSIYYAEDVVAHGPRGTLAIPTATDAMVSDYVDQIGEANPLYADDAFASASCCNTKIVPPMLIFCLSFSEFLRELTALEMPAAGSAGHVADEWRVHRPVSPGEPLRVVHQPLESRATRSRPELAVVRFGLQVIDRSGALVQSGVVTMMIPARSELES